MTASRDTMGFMGEWFSHPEWWFSAKKNSEVDDYITKCYGHLLFELPVAHQSPITTIIIYDQLPHHVFRKDRGAQHIVSYYLQKAIALVDFHKYNMDLMNTMTTHEWMFFWLPYRHSRDPKKCFEVLNHILYRLKTNINTSADDIMWLKRYLRATLQRFPTESQTTTDHLQYYPPSKETEHILPPYELQRKYMPLLDSETVLLSSSIYDMDPEDSGLFIDNRTTQHSLSYQMNQEKKRYEFVIVSLSGGVDSMVALDIARKTYRRVVAVHINYNNRKESKGEEMFLRDWCNYLGIPLFVRRITEVSRRELSQLELRDVYESYTKEVRFGTYAEVATRFTKNAIAISPPVVPVILGHHADDVVENIVQNITSMSKYENLNGMEEYTSIAKYPHITLWRPFLKTPMIYKTAILDYAHNNHVLYFKDTTSVTCTRGRYRLYLSHALDAYDVKTKGAFLYTSNVVSDLYDFMKDRVEEWSQLCQHGCLSDIKISSPPPHLPLFWKEYLQKNYAVVPTMKTMGYLSAAIKNHLETKKRVSVMIRKHVKLTIEKKQKKGDIIPYYLISVTHTA